MIEVTTKVGEEIVLDSETVLKLVKVERDGRVRLVIESTKPMLEEREKHPLPRFAQTLVSLFDSWFRPNEVRA